MKHHENTHRNTDIFNGNIYLEEILYHKAKCEIEPILSLKRHTAKSERMFGG